MEWLPIALRMFLGLAAAAATVLVCCESARGDRTPDGGRQRREALELAYIADEAEDEEDARGARSA